MTAHKDSFNVIGNNNYTDNNNGNYNSNGNYADNDNDNSNYNGNGNYNGTDNGNDDNIIMLLVVDFVFKLLFGDIKQQGAVNIPAECNIEITKGSFCRDRNNQHRAT